MYAERKGDVLKYRNQTYNIENVDIIFSPFEFLAHLMLSKEFKEGKKFPKCENCGINTKWDLVL